MHRNNDLPAEIIISKTNDRIVHMGWYHNDENMRLDGKISAIGYLSDGRVSYKHWNNGKRQRRVSGLPYEISHDESSHRARCIFTDRDDEIYNIDKVPVSYGWYE